MCIIREKEHLPASSEPKSHLLLLLYAKKKMYLCNIVHETAVAAVTGHCNKTQSPALIIHIVPIKRLAACSKPKGSVQC